MVKISPIGFNNKGLISVNWSDDIGKHFEAHSAGIAEFRCGIFLFLKAILLLRKFTATTMDGNGRIVSRLKNQLSSQPLLLTYDYTKTLGIKIIDGRDFSRDFADSNAVILNQAAVKRMRLKNPVGEMLKWNDKPMIVIGVIPDIQMESPFRPISPLTIIFNKDWVGYLDIRINPNMSASKAISLDETNF